VYLPIYSSALADDEFPMKSTMGSYLSRAEKQTSLPTLKKTWITTWWVGFRASVAFPVQLGPLEHLSDVRSVYCNPPRPTACLDAWMASAQGLNQIPVCTHPNAFRMSHTGGFQWRWDVLTSGSRREFSRTQQHHTNTNKLTYVFVIAMILVASHSFI
jgi:hypothetical protein